MVAPLASPHGNAWRPRGRSTAVFPRVQRGPHRRDRPGLITRPGIEFSPAFSGGLIEGKRANGCLQLVAKVFPRVQRGPHRRPVSSMLAPAAERAFSPAFSGGLIEGACAVGNELNMQGFPPRSAGASSKVDYYATGVLDVDVFPRVQRGPHRRMVVRLAWQRLRPQFSPAFSGGLIEGERWVAAAPDW